MMKHKPQTLKANDIIYVIYRRRRDDEIPTYLVEHIFADGSFTARSTQTGSSAPFTLHDYGYYDIIKLCKPP